MGITRQAAASRLRRYVELGLLVVKTASEPVSFEDLAKRDKHHRPATQVYHAAKRVSA